MSRSGVAAVLEVARALVQSDCRPQFSVIFVAFDKEEVKTEDTRQDCNSVLRVQVGSQGSHEFVRGYLVPQFFTGPAAAWPQFQGAVVLDTLLNYNSSAGSQVLPGGGEQLPASTRLAVAANQYRGDYIALVGRAGPEADLGGALARHWGALARDTDYTRVVDNREFTLTALIVSQDQHQHVVKNSYI